MNNKTETKIEALIQEGLGDAIRRNPGKSLMGAGLLGYGLGSHKVQPLVHKAIYNTPADNWRDVKGTVVDHYDALKDTPISNIPGNISKTVSDGIDSLIN